MRSGCALARLLQAVLARCRDEHAEAVGLQLRPIARTGFRIGVDDERGHRPGLDLRRERQETERTQQRLARDGLDEVVDRAEREPERRVVDDRHDDDRDLARRCRPLEPLQDLPAIEVGQQDVEDDRGRSQGRGPLDAGRARRARRPSRTRPPRGTRAAARRRRGRPRSRAPAAPSMATASAPGGRRLVCGPSERQVTPNRLPRPTSDSQVDGAAVRLDELAGERQPEAGALLARLPRGPAGTPRRSSPGRLGAMPGTGVDDDEPARRRHRSTARSGPSRRAA